MSLAMTHRTGWALAIVAILAASIGCRSRSYVVAVRNDRGVELGDIMLTYGEVEFRVGALARDARATWIGAGFVPEKGSLSWRTPDGMAHRAVFDIASQLPKDVDAAKAEVWLTIMANDQVSVAPWPRVHLDKGAFTN